MADKRTEILSLRLSAAEKDRLAGAAERHGKSASDYAREQIVRHLDDAFVFPGQNITVSLHPVPADSADIIRSLRLALAAAERLVAT